MRLAYVTARVSAFLSFSFYPCRKPLSIPCLQQILNKKLKIPMARIGIALRVRDFLLPAMSDSNDSMQTIDINKKSPKPFSLAAVSEQKIQGYTSIHKSVLGRLL